VWTTLGFVLNGLIFLLIGLELPSIIHQLGPVGLSSAIKYGVLITVLLIVGRILSTLGSSVFTVFISRYINTADNRPGWKAPLVLGWAGMRGVVSLAAALSIPTRLSDGSPFPQRDLILFITFVVIVLSLLVQGLSLPWLIRKLKLEDPDHRPALEEQDSQVRKRLAKFSLDFLKQQKNSMDNQFLQQLVARFTYDHLPPELIYTDDHARYKQIYTDLLENQRIFLVNLNKELEIDEAIIRKYQGLVDLEEEKLFSKFEIE
jgi:CPA1 family monovalent cation:H+ antiporter